MKKIIIFSCIWIISSCLLGACNNYKKWQFHQEEKNTPVYTVAKNIKPIEDKKKGRMEKFPTYGKEQEFLKKIPECQTEKLDTDIEIYNLSDKLINCKKIHSNWTNVNGLGGWDQSAEITNWTLTEHHDIWNFHDYKKAICKITNKDGSISNYLIKLTKKTIDENISLEPLIKKIENTIAGKWLIDRVSVDNQSYISYFGWSHFKNRPNIWYIEKNWHYIIVGSRRQESYEKIYVIDGILYRGWENRYFKYWWIEESERDFEQIIENKAIFKKITNTKILPLEENSESPWEKTTFDVETCELVL